MNISLTGLPTNVVMPPGTEDNVFDKKLYFRITSAALKIEEMIADSFDRRKFGINYRHFAILSILKDRTTNQQELANLIQANRNAMVQLIDQLEELNYAVRKVNPQNRREHQIFITDKGRRVLDQAIKVADEIEVRCSSLLSAEERRALTGLLTRICGTQ